LAILFALYNSIRIDNQVGFNKFLIVLLFLFGVGVIIIVLRMRTIRSSFSTKRLNKMINSVTDIADRNDIKLLGGDLNFFGGTPEKMEQNIQYSCLRNKKFQKILILCEKPKGNKTKICYGKILTDFKDEVELKFYDPDEADLRIRGRLFKISGVSKLLIFKKTEKSKYKAITTDTAKEEGALYNNLWDLIWSLAKSPTQVQKDEYLKLFESAK